MSIGSQPTPPSPVAVGNAADYTAQVQQLPLNIASQAGSQYQLGSPTGNQSIIQTGTGPGGVPLYSANTSYSPVEQQLFNQYTGTQQQAGSQAANALGFGNYGSISPTQQIGNETSGITGQLMNQWLGAQEPFYLTQTQQLDTQLRNQGLQPGQPAYDNAMRSLTTNQGYAVAGAASQFEPQAFNQASQLYGLPMNVASQLAQWGAPASATGQLASNNYLPGLQAPSVAAALQPYATTAQNQFAGQQGQYTANQSVIGGLFGLGGNALSNLISGGINLPDAGSAAALGIDLVGA